MEQWLGGTDARLRNYTTISLRLLPPSKLTLCLQTEAAATVEALLQESLQRKTCNNDMHATEQSALAAVLFL